jgi:hypothetical protein
MSDGDSSGSKYKNGSKLLMIGIPVITAIFAAFGSVYVVGQRTGKVNEVVTWKAEIAPRIEKMDAQGTLSFTHFKEQYDRVQDNQFKQLEELSRARYALEEKISHMNDADKAISGFDARLKKMEDEFSHFDVLEVEHRRLTKDFEQLKEEQRRKP